MCSSDLAQLRHLIVSNDEVNVSVNARGLLDSRDNLNDSPGESPKSVLFQQVEIPGNAACEANDYAVVFDPTETLETPMPAPYADYQVKVFESKAVQSQMPPDNNRVNGLIYRRSKPYIFTLEQCPAGACVTRQAAQAMLPNKGSVAVAPYKNSAFVDAKIGRAHV